jgi:serine/threonine protein kinase/predicted ATPase
LRPGEAIAGRYEIVRSVRAGGVSVVYEALDRDTDERVALKLINIPQAEDALVKRIEREIAILQQLQHPHIVRCHGSGKLNDGRIYLVLDWLEGSDLADFKSRAPLTLRRVLQIVNQVAAAIDAAHAREIIHRDIKPANIYLVRPDLGRDLDCRVLDFGVAKMAQANTMLTRAGAILGTPSYMAPEQANFAMSVDGRADIYSLGVVAFEVLSGKLPWTSPTDLARLARILVEEAIPVRQVTPDVPSSVADLIDAMIRHDAADRIGTAYEVRRRAERCLSELSEGVLETTFTRDEQMLKQVVRADTIDVIVIPAKGGRAASVISDVDELEALITMPPDPPNPEDSMDRRPVVPLSSLEDSVMHTAAEEPGRESGARKRRPPDFDEQLSYVDQTDRGLMFGRVQEVEQIRKRVLEPITRQHAGTTLVLGAAGIGKSRIRSEVAKLLRSSPSKPRVFAGRAEESLRSTPYAFVRRLILNQADIRTTDDPKTQVEKLAAVLPQGEALGELLEMSSPLFGFRVHSQEASAQDTGFFTDQLEGSGSVEEQRAIVLGFACEALRMPAPEIPPVVSARFHTRLFGEQMRRALDVILRALAEPRGLVVLIDDAHVLDNQSALVFARLLAEPNELCFSLAAFSLPSLLDTETRAPSPLAYVDAARIELAPLDPRASREFARSLVKGTIASPALEHLVNRAAGNPLYLEQLVRAVHDTGVLALGRDGELVLVGLKNDETDVDRVPPTVAAAVSARIQRKKPAEQKILTAAATFGDAFWVEGVALAVERDVEAVQLDLDRLAAQSFVRPRSSSRYPGATEMEFTHAVIRSVALSRLKRRRRHGYERSVVKYLESVGESDPALLAAHVSQSGALDDAAAMYADAAEASLNLGDPASAATLADEGLLLTEGMPLLRIKKRLIELVERIAIFDRDWAAGRDALEALEDLAETMEDRAEIAERRSRMELLARELRRAREHAAEAKRLWLEAKREQGSASAELRYAEACEALGDGRAALRAYLVAQGQFTENDVVGGLTKTARGLAAIALSSGDYRTAENRYRESLKHAHTIRDHDALFLANLGLAEVFRLTGDPEKARGHLDEVERVAFEPRERTVVEIHRGRLMAEEGNPGAAAERLWRLIEVAHERRDLSAPYQHAALFYVQLARDRRLAKVIAKSDEFRDHVEAALERARDESPALVLALTVGLAQASVIVGDRELADRLSREAIEAFTQEGAIVGDEPPCIFLTRAHVLEGSGGAKAELVEAMRAAVLHLDSIASRLDRPTRQRYLSRWVARAILEEAERAGLEVTRDADSNRIAAR